MCPKCGKEVKKINGVYVCSEGHISTAEDVKKYETAGIWDFVGDLFKQKGDRK